MESLTVTAIIKASCRYGVLTIGVYVCREFGITCVVIARHVHFLLESLPDCGVMKGETEALYTNALYICSI
jgi:precorrin-6x reductase